MLKILFFLSFILLFVSSHTKKTDDSKNHFFYSDAKKITFQELKSTTQKTNQLKKYFKSNTLNDKRFKVVEFPTNNTAIVTNRIAVQFLENINVDNKICLLYTSPSPRDS